MLVAYDITSFFVVVPLISVKGCRLCDVSKSCFSAIKSATIEVFPPVKAVLAHAIKSSAIEVFPSVNAVLAL